MLNLYETYYKLSADPFRLSPDHHFAYGHRGYANAKAYLEYAFFQGEGFVMVTGDPGTGKTTLINEILSGLDQSQMKVATLTTTQLDTRDLLHMVAVLFGMRVSEVSKPALLVDLKKYLTEQADRGWRSILVVDEAQGLSTSGLEELRLLANLQHRDRLLIQICLIGQDQLRDLVQTPQMEHLRQRIIAAAHLSALTFEETVDYVEHRLCHAGWKGDPTISEGALREIYRYSAGIPRLINLICNRLFLYGGLESKHGFLRADARQVIGELQQEQLLEHPHEDSAEPVSEDNDDDTSLDSSECEFSLPRFESVSATLQAVEESIDQQQPLTESNSALTPYEADAPEAENRDEPYISATGLDTLEQDEPLHDAEAEQAQTEAVSSSRRLMAILVLVIGLVLVLVFGSEAGRPLAGKFKAEWQRLVAPADTGQDSSSGEPAKLSTEQSPVPLPGRLPADPVSGTQGAPLLLPVERAPVGKVQRDVAPVQPPVAPEVSPAAVQTQSASDIPPVAALTEGAADAVVTDEVAPPAQLPEETTDWKSVIEAQKLRLEQEARQEFDRRVTEQFPQRKAPEAPVPTPPVQPQGAAQPVSEPPVALSALEKKPPVTAARVPRRPPFESLKDVHVALLEGRWTAAGKPAALLPSEITFCGKGDVHAQITCWSVPQYVEQDGRIVLNKVEAVLRGFSSQGDFELVYESLSAPVDTDVDQIAWQSKNHRLLCEFSQPERVVCLDAGTGERVVEFQRSTLSNSNSVGVDPQERVSG